LHDGRADELRHPAIAALRAQAIALPLGRLLVAGDAAGAVCLAEWEDDAATPPPGYAAFRGGLVALGGDAGPAVPALEAYFAGDIRAIEGLSVAAPGTPFQHAVWAELRRIPAGATASYGEIARRIGRPSAVRAVGLANGSNPVGIIVPCHRVIGADGRLTGYGGGLPRKRWLLDHEARHAAGGAAARLAGRGGTQLQPGQPNLL
jgi:methylated-DNA-[protein]-cysteine S-methyltransferase